MYRTVRDLKIIRDALLLLPISYVPLIARLSIRDNATNVENQIHRTLSFRSIVTFYVNFEVSWYVSRYIRDEIYMCQKVVSNETRQIYFGTLRNLFTYYEKETSAIQSRRRVTHYVFINSVRVPFYY